MKARRLTAQNFAVLIRAFYDAHGAEQMKASYDWDAPSVTMFKGERIWAFEVNPNAPDAGELVTVGWGSMHFNTRDAEDGDAALVVGVFPAYQRHGYRTVILDWMCERAKELGATSASSTVYKTNEAHYKRRMREAHAESSAWIYAGDVWFPAPGYGMFVRPLK